MGDSSTPADLAGLSAKYAAESQKRVRADGAAQYEELGTSASARLRRLDQDLWVDHAALNAQTPCLRDGDEVRFLILGAGYGGLLYAIHLVKQGGISPSDIRIVDVAGGFGGTWWWNRFPGLTCDTEGYVYMPLLEETGYMPKHRYSGGQELLAYANIMAEHWGLHDKALFRTSVRSYDWDEGARRWVVRMEEDRGPEGVVPLTVRAQFTVVANGVLNHPKVPRHFEAFEGPIMHTARWDFGVSGGTPDEPVLEGLRGKRVGILGTGATAVQVTPEVARYAGELYVFQRTPSSVAEKPQQETDPEQWRAMTAELGWHRRRQENMDGVIACEPGVEDVVNDGWTGAKTFRALTGGYHETPITLEGIPAHIAALMAEDGPRSERLRRRVEETVTDEKTAEALKAWYPTWCKRPTFHNEYLPTFNLPHVHLVDTQGRGAERATQGGIVADGVEYPLDVLILGTGYRAPSAGLAEPGYTSNMTIRGRGGLLMGDKWREKGPSTFHGVASHDFPNMFLSGPMQIGASSTFSRVQDVLGEHCAYMMAEGLRRAGGDCGRVLVEATAEGEEVWAGTLMRTAAWFAAGAVCGPSYNNNEGELGKDPAEQMKLARAAPYGGGLNAYVRELEAWRAEGSMKHMEVTW